MGQCSTPIPDALPAGACRPSMSRASRSVVRRAALACWFGCAVVAATALAADESVLAVIDAARFAYGLESEYWEDPSAFDSPDDLYAHYRQGFSPDLAAAMTAHTLASQGDLATWAPEQVFVAELGVNDALVWFPTPPAFGQDGVWGLADYMHLRLRREGDRWVVYWGRDLSAPPAQ